MWISAAWATLASLPVVISPLLRMRTLPRELDLLSGNGPAESAGDKPHDGTTPPVTDPRT